MSLQRRWSKIQLRILAVLLVAALGLSACGGGSSGGSATPDSGGAAPAGGDQSGGGAAPAPEPEKPKLRVAMVLPGTVEDADYNFVGYRALLDLKEAYGVETTYQERVAPADAERVARGFINDGFNVVAFHGGQFVTTVNKLAPQFPDVNFIMESSGEMPDLPPNVWNIGRKFYQGFYSLGTLGALSTKTNKIGILLGIKLPDFVASINAIQDAVRAVNPDIQVLHTFVGDQNDPVKARQAAEAMINEGVDFIILVVNLGAFGVIEAAKDKPVLITTYYTDKTGLAPQNFAGSLLLDFGVPYKSVVGQILEGKRTGYEEQRPGNGMSLSPLSNVPDAVAQQVRDTFDKVASGALVLTERNQEVEP